ncbi:hypothetical protein HYX08_03620 [Candidatus Woesearchaeota archaeon]|nr:hypothetical protein [Candidatus Woesearchaeota archaeon]
MQTQANLLKAMEQDFKVERKIFLNIRTGWYDRSKDGDNLVSAKDISVEPIQGRYRLNFNDNMLRVQEFFFDVEWSPFTVDGKKIEVATKETVNQYFLKLKKAAKRLLFLLLKYIPKDKIYIRVSGTGLHIIFFGQGLERMHEFMQISKFFILKSKLPNTKNTQELVFGLDRDTILSSDRKISEFGSWNKLKKDFKKEVDYLNYATYLSVDEFFKAKSYPFCDKFEDVKYPKKYETFIIPEELYEDAKNANLEEPDNPVVKEAISIEPLANRQIAEFTDSIPENDPAFNLVRSCKCYWNMLRDRDATWYARQFLVKFLKYALNLNKEQILQLIDKYTGWSDYDPRITAFYVNKHFRKGTCETKVMKPPKKKTLIKFGLCENDCRDCIYTYPAVIRLRKNGDHILIQ